MRTTQVTIAGTQVEVPNREIPELIATLTAALETLQVSGTAGIKPAKGFMSYDDAEEILSEYYSGQMLRRHTGNLLGAMYRMARQGEVSFNMKCSLCKKKVTFPISFGSGVCTHSLASSSDYAYILFSKASIQAKREAVLESTMRTVGPAIKTDYVRIAYSLS